MNVNKPDAECRMNYVLSMEIVQLAPGETRPAPAAGATPFWSALMRSNVPPDDPKAYRQ